MAVQLESSCSSDLTSTLPVNALFVLKQSALFSGPCLSGGNETRDNVVVQVSLSTLLSCTHALSEVLVSLRVVLPGRANRYCVEQKIYS